MLFFTGFTRDSYSIAQEQINNVSENLKKLHKTKELVGKAKKILLEGDLDDFGYLLHEAWCIKRSFSQNVSTEFIDQMYDKALCAGALGGKLLGSGGGGFLLFYVKPDKQEHIKKQLANLLNIPFEFESNGTNIMYSRL